MTWPVPVPGAIKARSDAAFIQALGFDEDGRALPQTPDVVSPNSVLFALGAIAEETFTEAYGYQRSLADELMPDRAQDWLERHGSDWGVPRRAATRAVGNLVFVGPVNLPLPLGIEVGTGPFWITTAPAVIGSSGAVSIPAQASAAGAASNLAGNTVLPLVSPIAGLAPQSCTADADGFQDGLDDEDIEAWRARILGRIRNPGAAGTAADYRKWATEAGVPYCGVYGSWTGPGSVGLVIAQAGPAVAPPAVVAAVAAYIEDARRPVTAQVIVVAAALLPIDVVLAVYPDSTGVRVGVQTALAAQMLLDGDVGKVIPIARLVAACQSVTGEFGCTITSPAGDIVPARNQIPVLNSVTFTAGYVPVAADGS